jgi:CRP/FNR family cyclic AMP-dependent transcriptional regulator
VSDNDAARGHNRRDATNDQAEEGGMSDGNSGVQAPAATARPRVVRRPPLPKEVREKLRHMPELEGLDEQTQRALEARVWHRTLPAGARFIVEDSAAEAMFFVLSGEIRVIADDCTVGLEAAPRTIGLLSLLDHAPRTASVEAFSDIDVVMLMRDDFEVLLREHPHLVRQMVRFLTAEIRKVQQGDERTRHSFDDHFHSPNARLVQGPYVMSAFQMTALVMQTTPERVDACLPAGIHAMPRTEGRYLLTLNDFPAVYSEHPAAAGQTFAYRETTPFIPVVGPGMKPAVFSPELYLDSYMPIVLGRELYGFPKRYGRAIFGERHIDLHVSGSLAFRAKWQDTAALAAGELLAMLQNALFGLPSLPGQAAALESLFGLVDRPLLREHWPAMPVLVHSQVPDGRRDGETMRIDEIVEIPFCVRRVWDFELLREAEVIGFEDWLLQGRCVAGVRLRMEASFGRAHRPVNYAASARSSLGRAIAPWRSLVRSARQLRAGLQR